MHADQKIFVEYSYTLIMTPLLSFASKPSNLTTLQSTLLYFFAKIPRDTLC